MSTHKGPMQGPALDHYSDTPLFNTKAVVQQTGVAAPTLRAWERRYTLITPERANNTYRLYSERDVAMIRWLKERIDEGLSISQAIAFFRHLNEEPPPHATHRDELQPSNDPPTPIFEIASTAPSTSQSATKRSSRTSAVHETKQEKYKNLRVSTNSHSAIPHLSMTQKSLIEAFKRMNEATTSLIMGSLLTVYPVEQVCIEVITPTMWRVGQLWAEGQLTVASEHFASNFFRCLLSNILQITPYAATGPLALVCCAPGEAHELASLMLALFLRRRNLRVIYLGQSIETASLLDTVRWLAPALVCVSLTIPAYLSTLIHLGQQIQELPDPRPLFVYGGQAFQPFFAADIPPQFYGIHIDGDLMQVAEQLQIMVATSINNRQ